MTDAICIWDPVYRLQFIGLGRGGGKRKVIMLEGKHCIACACVCVSLSLSCQRKLDHPCVWVWGFLASKVWAAVQCGMQGTHLLSSSGSSRHLHPFLWLPGPPRPCQALLMIHYLLCSKSLREGLMCECWGM